MKTVVTTIFPPTDCLIKFSDLLSDSDKLIVIGDKKGPEKFELRSCDFYSLDKQLKTHYRLSGILPTSHYSRKNIGYLIAMQSGETCIYETDDDNEPNRFWQKRDREVSALVAEKSKWINIYKHFTDENIWPRGFLLDKISAPDSTPKNNGLFELIEAPIQQGLADNSPDVDAIWRLTQDRDFFFERRDSIALPEGSWCPFNTQSTWWWKEAFPLLYLPSFCSFRMTDIWKSFVAQRCLWEMGYKMVFHSAEVNQKRNLHNLMRDFEAEIQGYTQNERLTNLLEDIQLLPGKENTLRNLVICYESLIDKSFLPQEEMELVKAWVIDVEQILY